MSEHIPDAGTPEHFDYLLDSLEAEVRLSERYDIELESVDFYKDQLRGAYHHTRQSERSSDLSIQDVQYAELCLYAAHKTYERTRATEDKLMVIAYLGRLITMMEGEEGDERV